MVKRLNTFLSHFKHLFSSLFFQRLPLYLFALTLCAMASWYSYNHFSLFPFYEKKLWNIMLSSENAINDYLNTQERHTTTLASHPITQKFLYDLTQKNISEQEMQQFSTFINHNQERMKFKNIFLLDTAKTILFSTEKNSLGIHLTDEQYKNSPLSKSFERSTMSLTTDFAQFSFDPLLKKPSLFISTPIVYNKKMVGIFAYEYDPQEIYNITHQFIGLGHTGETALAQRDGNFITFIAPTRNDHDLAFKKRELFGSTPVSIKESILGRQGTGTAIDYREQAIIGAWTFIPKVNWGMIVKIDQSEVTQPLYTTMKIFIILMLIIFIWILAIEFFCGQPLLRMIQLYNDRFPFNRMPYYSKNIFFILSLFVCILLIKSSITYYFIKKNSKETSQKLIADQTKKDAIAIENILKRIEFTTESIADDLQSHRLSHEDIEKRLKRELSENTMIMSITIAFAPYAYNKTKRLYAPSIQKNETGYTTSDISHIYDYTDPNASNIMTAWYQSALKNGKIWIDPYKDKDNNSISPCYSFTFFGPDKKPRGVVSIAYSLESIKRIVEYGSLQRVGYSFLMTKQGTFLFHPITQLVTSAKTFLHYAQENGDEELIQIIEKISYNMPLLTSYHSSITQQQTWIYTHPITNNQWTLGVIFPKEDISLKPKDIRHYSFVLLTYSILYLILICLFLYSVRKIRRSTATILISITILIGLMASWYSIQKTTTSTFASDTTITDQANLDKFLDDLSEETERKHEDIPIIIPCGLLLYSIDITSPDHMTVSGYIWNRYNTKQHTDISRQIQIPHATNLQIRDPLLSKSGDWETVTWNIRGTIYQKQDYSHFPFDLQHMQITLEHYDIEKNIILVPDLAAYKKISPEDTPGIDKSITLSEFNFEKTFFNYKQITPKTNFGVPTYGKATDHFILLFNIVTTRGLLTPFIIFFLPLLVVLLSLFATLVISTQRTNPFKALAPYTGLFFSLIVLQRSLREQYPTNTTLYMEYAFFFTYITIIILVIHTIITYTHPNWHYYQKQIFPLLKFLFWPFQLISWFITTLIVFY